MNPVALTLAALATWRIAHFLHSEDGPRTVMARLRRVIEARGARLFDCFLCISVWPALAAALVIGAEGRQIVIVWPALSAAAILIERMAFRETFADPVEVFEDPPPAVDQEA